MTNYVIKLKDLANSLEEHQEVLEEYTPELLERLEASIDDLDTALGRAVLMATDKADEESEDEDEDNDEDDEEEDEEAA